MIQLDKPSDIQFQIIKNFILGGTIIASVSYLATFVNPVIAAIWWSYPLSIVPTIYFMKHNGQTNKYISKFLFSTTFALGLLALCILFISYYLEKSNNNEGVTPSILKSSLLWFVGTIGFYILIIYGGFKHYFI